ncbi:interferon-inducible GTPase 5-like [Amblyraja radiata]|uniref:interferon-inducible GTPase 5-like n=1 Tax=Amblyraja radiata TaxID=386614 RepID=UPI001401F58A|nr:interferon-inducible GTPase 5-like [Amblyraja radiata]XP_032881970.1 interferon-inducible GTPase 5-like [Amblyraja radiata]
MAGAVPNLCYNRRDVLDVVAAYRRGGVQGLQLAIDDKNKQMSNVHVRIAVMGESGSGKSSLINALLDLDDEEAASTGFNETTTEITPYSHPSLPNVHCYDFPGLNTPNFPVKAFMKKTKFAEYDLGIIVIERWTDNDQLLAKALKKAGKSLYVVRSKIDQIVKSERGKKGYNEDVMLQSVWKNCCSSLEKAGIGKTRVFLYSSFDLNAYDFPELQKTVVSDLSETQKQLFLLSLPNTSEDSINEKREALRMSIECMAAISAAIAVIPVPGLSLACDLVLIASNILAMRKILGLDNESLGKLAKRVGKRKYELRRDTKHAWVFGEINQEQVVLLLKRSTVAAVLTVAELVLDFVPILSSGFGATTSYWVTRRMLTNSLEEMVETAKIVLRNAEAAASATHGRAAGY